LLLDPSRNCIGSDTRFQINGHKNLHFRLGS
jgi:hypothetical protein